SSPRISRVAAPSRTWISSSPARWASQWPFPANFVMLRPPSRYDANRAALPFRSASASPLPGRPVPWEGHLWLSSCGGLRRRLAAVDEEHLTGRKGRPAGCKEDDCVGDLVRRADALE